MKYMADHQQRGDAFIARRKQDNREHGVPEMTWESEHLARFAFSQGLAEGYEAGLREGAAAALENARRALGLGARGEGE